MASSFYFCFYAIITQVRRAAQLVIRFFTAASQVSLEASNFLPWSAKSNQKAPFSAGLLIHFDILTGEYQNGQPQRARV